MAATQTPTPLAQLEIVTQERDDYKKRYFEINAKYEALKDKGADNITLTQPYANAPILTGFKTTLGRFMYRDRTTFGGDFGYSISAFLDRSKAALDRAIDPHHSKNRLGFDPIAETFNNVPVFDKGNYLQITVEIVNPGIEE